jgi:hypothetical protein
MRARRSTPRARKMAMKREMLAEIARQQQMAARLLAELDAPTPRADRAVVLEGKIIGDKIITEAETD